MAKKDGQSTIQFRIKAEDRRSVKIAAADQDMRIGEYLLWLHKENIRKAPKGSVVRYGL